MLPLNKIDTTWTLFLDRDGVINHEKEEDYIHTWDEFVFYDGALDALRIFAKRFRRIIVITNQKGVGKGLTKLDDLHTIHYNMEKEIEKNGGRLDAVLYCTDLDNESSFRKPNPGMGLQAAKQFTDIDLSKAIMVGNRMSDMSFGRNLGIYTVYLPTTHPGPTLNDEKIDAVYDSLIAFAHALQ